MDDEIRNSGLANDAILVGDRSQRNVQRATKRSAPANSSPMRKQMLMSGISTSTPLRGTSGIVTSRANEASEGLTYQVVQIASPESGHRLQNVSQRTAAHIIASNGQELVTNSGHSIVLNPGGGLTLSAAAVQDGPVGRVTYVPANTISVTTSPTVNQSIQLQSFDGGGGQYYIMLPSGSEILQAASTTPVVTASATASPARVIAAPRIQQAAFIPLSRLEPVQTTSISNLHAASGAAAHVVKQLDFHVGSDQPGGGKEVKRRVSHNEVEKRRRDKINNWIAKLARVVPNSTVDFANAKTPQSKGGVLAKTVDFIQELRESNDQLAETVRHYDSVVKCLQEENKHLRETMQQAGVEAPPPISSDFGANADLLLAIEAARTASVRSTVSLPVTSASGMASESSNTVSTPNTDVPTSSVSNSKGSTLVLVHTTKGSFIQNLNNDNDTTRHDSEDGRDEEDSSGDE